MWIKVCGIRDTETAVRLAELDVNAVGLNFYSKSSRVVTIEAAVAISRILPKRVERVGVFVNHSVDEIQKIAVECDLDVLQLHGDEPASLLIELQRRMPHKRLIRAWRMGEAGLNDLESLLEVCRRARCDLAGCLVDAHVSGVYGGSGKTVSWQRLFHEYDRDRWPPLILAGGLTPTNIASAIVAIQPWGVDVASGVESSAGVKDLTLVQQFVANARHAMPH
jgi:phosphoribosylanthranilate isomerase